MAKGYLPYRRGEASASDHALNDSGLAIHLTIAKRPIDIIGVSPSLLGRNYKACLRKLRQDRAERCLDF
jgi:hypothetical protein